VLAFVVALLNVIVAGCIQHPATTKHQACLHMSEPIETKTQEYREIQLTPKIIGRFKRKVSQQPDEKGCLLWLAGKFTSGYGMFSVNGEPFKANRVAFLIANGYLPQDMCVMHTCDVPACCNPEHLTLGTHADNAADRNKKGRLAFGERSGAYTHPERVARGERHGSVTKPESVLRGDDHWTRLRPDRVLRGENHPARKDSSHIKRGSDHKLSKFKEEDILRIRAKYANGDATQVELAAEYHCKQPIISAIVNRKTWKHI
jgi:hypothetical protein